MNEFESELSQVIDTVFDKPELDEKKLRANLALVQNLFDLVQKYPHLRFGQILISYGFVTETNYDTWKKEFFTDSETTLERVESRRRQERAGPRPTE